MANSNDNGSTTDEQAVPSSSSPKGENVQKPPGGREVVGTGVIGGAVLLLLGAIALIVVIVQNSHDVEFEFLWLDVTTPLVVVILVACAFSIVVDELVGFVWRRRRRIRIKERQELERLRAER